MKKHPNSQIICDTIATYDWIIAKKPNLFIFGINVEPCINVVLWKLRSRERLFDRLESLEIPDDMIWVIYMLYMSKSLGEYDAQVANPIASLAPLV